MATQKQGDHPRWLERVRKDWEIRLAKKARAKAHKKQQRKRHHERIGLKPSNSEMYQELGKELYRRGDLSAPTLHTSRLLSSTQQTLGLTSASAIPFTESATIGRHWNNWRSPCD